MLQQIYSKIKCDSAENNNSDDDGAASDRLTSFKRYNTIIVKHSRTYKREMYTEELMNHIGDYLRHIMELQVLSSAKHQDAGR